VGGLVWSTSAVTFGASLLLVPLGLALTLVAARRSPRDTVFWIAVMVNTIDVLTIVAFAVEGVFPAS
jgi:hypothetical protein